MNVWFIDWATTKHTTSNKGILENYVQYQEQHKYLPGRQHSNSCTWRRESQTPYSKQYS